MNEDREHQQESTGEPALEPFFTAARAQREVPLDPMLVRHLTEQALALMPASHRPAQARRWRFRWRDGGWLDCLTAPSGLAGAAGLAGLAGLAIGLWAPGLAELAGGALAWTGAPLVEPGMPWGEDAGLLALIDG